ncbi:MAG: BTAD domain-containing putative transcriptional regulator [Gaiellaceae bacterium]
MGLDFKILGPLEVMQNGQSLALGGKPRTLLAFFLLHANEVVSSERLMDALWGERPPETAHAALQVHVSQLRKLLGQDRIATRSPGYAFRLAPEELDATRFEVLSTRADGHESSTEALALWRGPPLAEFQYEPWAQSEIARLEELRAAVRERDVEQALAAGRHIEVVSDIEAIVREYPLRERPRAQLMLALYRCSRQAEALSLYQETRRLLVEELGIEPGPELQELHRRVLNHDPTLAAPTTAVDEAQSADEPREERKVVTVLFCDLVGFTSRAEQLDPEDVSRLLSRYHLRLRAELERHGGTVEKFVGDAVLALFGAPAAHEDDPERAVRAALAICDWIAELGDDLEVRIGISTGETVVRLGAQAAEGEALAVGDVVNTASRLQQAAPRGAVLVGESTYRATRSAIAYERLEPVVVKGKTDPVPVWLARSPRRARESDLERPTTPFVGREDDLLLLEQTLTRSLHGSALQLVTLVGEPGIGKTRLVGEFRARVEGRSEAITWRQGRCLAYGDGITFWALGQIVKEEAGILESDPPDVAETKLAANIERFVDESDRKWLNTRLAPLVGAAGPEQSTNQEEAFAAWRTYLEAVAAKRPLVLVVEDLHWADAALLAFLDHLVEWGADVPLLIVATARPEIYERAPEWAGGKRNTTTLSLSPLQDADTACLVSALLANAALPAAIEAILFERAGGNPLYAEEFVRMLDDRGLLSRGDEDGLEIPVPEGIQGVIAARLDTLPPDGKALMHDASVVGKVFWAGALAAMGGGSKESVLAGLHDLARKELVRRVRQSSIEDDVEYIFWHVLVRDVAYAQIPRAARARKHVAAARWIERIAGERSTDHAEFLASHYSTALELARAAGQIEHVTELRDAAVRFTTLAAERAIRFDHAQGARYYRGALELLPQDDPRRPRLLAVAAGAGTTTGMSFDQIKLELQEAIAGLRAQGNLTAAGDALRQLSFAMYGRTESLAFADEARRLLEPGGPTPELALVYDRLAQEESIAGRSQEGLAWSEKALPLLERFGLDDEALATRSRLATGRCELGDRGALDELRQLAHEAVRPERNYATHPITNVLNNLAVSELYWGAGSAAAGDALRAAIDLAKRRGLERPTRWYQANLVETLYDVGEWDEALRLNEEIVAWERVKGESTISMIGSPSAARILAARSQLDAAAALVDELLPRARDTHQHSSILQPFLVAAAAVASASGDSAGAVAYVQEFEQSVESLRDVVACVPDIGRICAGAGELSLFDRLLDSLEPDPRLARFVSTAGAILCEARGQSRQAELLYAEADEGWRSHDCVVEHAHALLGLGRCCLALGRPDDAAASLREAREVLSSLGAALLLAQTEELLAEATAVSL